MATGTPRELIGQLGAAHVVTLVTTTPVEVSRFATLPHIDGLEVEANTARFRTTDAVTTLAALTRLLEGERTRIVDLQVRKGSLEDVFLRLTGEEKTTDLNS